MYIKCVYNQNDEHTEYLQSICTIVNMQNTNLNTDDFIKHKSYYQDYLCTWNQWVYKIKPDLAL